MPHIVHVMTVPASLVFLTGQVAFMRKRGFEMSVISSPDPALDAFGAREGVPVYGVEMPRAITPANDLKSLARLAARLRSIRPDIVHAHTPKGGLLGMMAAAIARVPARIYHMRGLPMMTATGTRRAILTNTERVSCGLAHRVLCVSHSLREFAIDEHLVKKEKIQVLLAGSGNGVDCDVRFDPARLEPEARSKMRVSLGIPEDSPVVTFIGRLVKDKGIEELAAAWSALKKRYPSVHLVLAGTFEPQDPVSVEARRALEDDRRVHLVGFVSDTPRLYAASDIVTLPTYREGFPNVPLETASMGLPIVATRVAGCVDAVKDGETGLLVPPRDGPALAAALARYLDNPALRARHGAAGRARVLRDFRPLRIWEALAEVYDSMLPAATSARASEYRGGVPNQKA